uniref:Selenoprotein n=1 Tax=virus sp. ctkyY8 TaxID=2827995 RepID=A0A8S5RF33_9VIRU|nr:MAG TPA: Selenoprotein [virus sp. ctkyY8]
MQSFWKFFRNVFNMIGLFFIFFNIFFWIV